MLAETRAGFFVAAFPSFRPLRDSNPRPITVHSAIDLPSTNRKPVLSRKLMSYSAFLQPSRVGSHRGRTSHLPISLATAAALLILVLAAPAKAGDDATAKAKTPANQKYPPESIEFFESRVRPILVDKCFKCHGEKKQSNGLRLDSREATLKGGDSGPALVAGKPDESLLVQAVAHTHAELKMPPSGKLPEASVAALRQWVALGAPWPTASGTSPASTAKAGPDAAAHWAFRPIQPVSPPAVKNRAMRAIRRRRVRPGPARGSRAHPVCPRRETNADPPRDDRPLGHPADRRRKSTRSRPTDRRTRSPALVDRLLASPRYGERWGRHWLDVARYADTKGYVFTQDRRYPYAYTYRDYVIAAFNADLGYDRFVVQQLAADQLARGDDRRPLAAMGFLTVGRRFLLDQNEIIDDRIDVVSRGLLGLTVTCARCHDHKFDPIPTEDYYSLYGVFASSVEPAELPLLADATADPRYAEYQKKARRGDQSAR